jgi:hypothetical protein
VADFLAVPVAHDAFAAAHHAAGSTIIGAASADSHAMLAAAAAALGPIGAGYLAAYAPAQTNNLTAGLQVGHVHHAIGVGTQAFKTAVVAADNA